LQTIPFSWIFIQPALAVLVPLPEPKKSFADKSDWNLSVAARLCCGARIAGLAGVTMQDINAWDKGSDCLLLAAMERLPA